MTVSSVLEPLIKRQLFANQDAAVRELTRDYILRHIEELSKRISQFEIRHGMTFGRFDEYLRERSALLASPELDDVQRRILGQAIMREEDDWLEWKADREILESWLGIQQEVKN